MTNILIKDNTGVTETRRQCDHRCGDWSDVATKSELEASLVHIVNSRLAWGTYEPLSQNKQTPYLNILETM